MNLFPRGLILAVLIAAGPASAGAAAIVIDVIPGGAVDASRIVTVGDSFVVDVLLADAADFAGFQFDVDFDPVKLTAANITSGNVFGLDTVPLVSSIGVGTLTFAETTLAVGGLNVAAPLRLASLQFAAGNLGTSPLTLLNVVLSDSQALPIDVLSLGNGQVTVNPQAVPEPSSLVLLTTGGLLWLRRRRRAGGA